VVHFQYRGHGRSERPRDPEHVALMESVIETAFELLKAEGPTLKNRATWDALHAVLRYRREHGLV
jgi:hypothetical protein